MVPSLIDLSSCTRKGNKKAFVAKLRKHAGADVNRGRMEARKAALIEP